jgi:hypothetical protein
MSSGAAEIVAIVLAEKGSGPAFAVAPNLDFAEKILERLGCFRFTDGQDHLSPVLRKDRLGLAAIAVLELRCVLDALAACRGDAPGGVLQHSRDQLRKCKVNARYRPIQAEIAQTSDKRINGR